MNGARSTDRRAPRRASAWYWARDELHGLDPVADHERIAHLVNEVRYGDAPLTAALYTVAFCRQMAVPSIAAVVHRGGESPIMQDTRGRNDTTMTFFGEFLTYGHSSDLGRRSIAKLNEIHARFPITGEQSLYTLASLTFEADRTARRLGVRLLTGSEKLANFHFWRGVGHEMGLTEIPHTYEELWDWTLAYEAEHYAFSPGGRAVADAMLHDFASRFLPAPMLRVGRELVLAAMDERLLGALALRTPRYTVQRSLRLGLAGYALARRALPDPAERSWMDTYAAGFRPE